MTVIFPPAVQVTREQNTDAFDRIRTVEPHTLLEYKCTRGKNPLQIIEDISGSATSTVDSSSGVDLATTGTGSVHRYTINKATYQPGKSLSALWTGVYNNGSNASTVTTRGGMFESTHGVFIEYNDGLFYIVKRENSVDTRISEPNWDTPNGINGLGYTLDSTKAQIFGFDMEWLGVGSIRFFVFHEGKPVILHTFHHDNIVDAAYIKHANLPLRYEIDSTGGSGSMKTICGTVISEGGYEPESLMFTANRGSDSIRLDAAENSPIFSIRMKNGSIKNSRVAIKNITVVTEDSTTFLMELYYCPPGSSPLSGASWTSADSNSVVEYDIDANSVNLSGCTKIYSTYTSKLNDPAGVSDHEVDLGVKDNGDSAYYIVVVTNLQGTNKDFYAGMTWTEYF